MTNTPSPRPDVEGIAAHSKHVVKNGLISPIRLELLIDEDIPALIAYIGRLEGRIKELDGKVYLKGHWRCPKCDFYCVSTLIDAGTGKFAADQEPQKCANGCGPMWRVTHEESANNMVAHAEEQADRMEKLEAEIQGWRDCIIVNAQMDGAKFMGIKRDSARRMWEKSLVALGVGDG